MSTISAAAVNELRKRTDQPLMDCKKALTENGGDMEKAIEWLRARSKTVTVKREGNETAEGRVGTFVDNAAKVAAIVEFRCESAPTAANERVVALVADMAKAAATGSAGDVAGLLGEAVGGGTLQDRLTDVSGVIREKMVLHRFKRLSGGTYGSYVHHDGTVGVLLECSGANGTAEVLRDVSAHIAALNPQYTLPSEVPADVLAKEKDLAMQQIQGDEKNKGKPANIIEKIAEGKLKTWLAETVLTEQPMANSAKYPNQTVGQALQKAGLTAVKFVRYKVGAVAN
jgi:elongation factor Ts